MTTVPYLSGIQPTRDGYATESAVMLALRARGLLERRQTVIRPAFIPGDSVVGLDPPEGTRVPVGSTITVQVSERSPVPLTLPPATLSATQQLTQCEQDPATRAQARQTAIRVLGHDPGPAADQQIVDQLCQQEHG
jgi:beta-lactam-binding protein with PASTA domain